MSTDRIESNRRGRVLVDFGAAPGTGHTTATVGVHGMTSEEDVRCWVLPVATDDHAADDVAIEAIEARAVPSADYITIHVFSTNNSMLFGEFYVAWAF